MEHGMKFEEQFRSGTYNSSSGSNLTGGKIRSIHLLPYNSDPEMGRRRTFNCKPVFVML
jgi:hypothetical protein